MDSNGSLGQIVGAHVKVVLGNTRRRGPRVVSRIDLLLLARGTISREDVASLALEASPSPGYLRDYTADDERCDDILSNVLAHVLTHFLGCFLPGFASFEEAQDVKGKQSCVEGLREHVARQSVLFVGQLQMNAWSG